MPYVKVNDIQMYYEQKGQGPHLVLIGGLTNNATVWSLMVDDLAKHFSVILPENRGAGRSTQPKAHYTIDQMADDTAYLLDQLNIDAAYMVGFSMGGNIVQKLCLNHANKVKAAIMANSTARFSKVMCLQFDSTIKLIDAGVNQELILDTVYPWIYASNFLENSANIDKEKNRMLTDPYPQSYEGYVGQIKALEQVNTLADLRKIICPVLVIVGEDDLLIPMKYSEVLANLIPNAKMAVIKNCGHMTHREKPEEFNHLIIDFFSKYET